MLFWISKNLVISFQSISVIIHWTVDLGRKSILARLWWLFNTCLWQEGVQLLYLNHCEILPGITLLRKGSLKDSGNCQAQIFASKHHNMGLGNSILYSIGFPCKFKLQLMKNKILAHLCGLVYSCNHWYNTYLSRSFLVPCKQTSNSGFPIPNRIPSL